MRAFVPKAARRPPSKLRPASPTSEIASRLKRPEYVLTSKPWYKDAIIYELHVRAFMDSDGNGTGDFAGLTGKLGYLHDLGVTALWLLPFCPSPWRDDGYDVADYAEVHPAYGCLADFRRFLDECKRRGLRVITEFVLNHTSDAHPWFQRARRSPAGSPERDCYVWSDTPEKYSGARVIFKDFEASNWTWDPIAQSFFFHRFYSHQPDLNYESPEVQQAALDTVDFWFGIGVDGIRLDAVPYLFEREGTTCENLPETHQFLRKLRRHVDEKFSDRMLLAEANQWSEDAVAYFGQGDECHMAFHFPLMPRLFMAMRMEDAFPIIHILQQTPSIPDSCQWANFLRCHDELTLEMVCEEERDYMYNVYARDQQMRLNVGIRRRLAPLLENDRRRIELLNGLLLSLPGTPVIYYGDEIGMGDNLQLGDRDGVRTPMQWNSGKNGGFSNADPERLYLPPITGSEYDYALVNVEIQESKPHSLLWWMRNAIAVRKETTALTHGSIHFLKPGNRSVLAFVRQYEDEAVLVVANLSRFAQPVKLDLGEYVDHIPTELFGRVKFPMIPKGEYTLSLGPYGFHWFELRKRVAEQDGSASARLVASVSGIFEWENRKELADIVAAWLSGRLRRDDREVTNVEIVDLARFGNHACLAIFEIHFSGGDPELQLLPLAIRTTDSNGPQEGMKLLCSVEDLHGFRGALCAGAANGEISNALTALIDCHGSVETHCGRFRGKRVGAFAAELPGDSVCLIPTPHGTEQRNVSILLGDVYVLKIYRKLDPGSNPDLEAMRFLFERASFNNVVPTAGVIEYTLQDGEPIVAAVLHAYAANRGDLWQYTLAEFSLFLERAGAEASTVSKDVSRLLHDYAETASLLGKRTAEMHLAFSSGVDDPDFAPEPFDTFCLRGLAHNLDANTRLVMRSLRAHRKDLRGYNRQLASSILELDEEIRRFFRDIIDIQNPGMRTRIHGDLHLAQVLHTGDDVVFIDFEGDNSRPLAERVLKRSPLMDVASMLISFRYVIERAVITSRRSREEVEQLAQVWYTTSAGAYLNQYRATVGDQPILPEQDRDFRQMLGILLLAKAVYAVGYEIENRPAWVTVALRSLLDVWRRVRNGEPGHPSTLPVGSC
jgi:maltose alpha-D-glucosyltransferase / alpha-amylase